MLGLDPQYHYPAMIQIIAKLLTGAELLLVDGRGFDAANIRDLAHGFLFSSPAGAGKSILQCRQKCMAVYSAKPGQ
jgi:hypothetical protein